MEEALPTGSPAATDAAELALQRLAATPLTSLVQAQALVAELLARQQALALENQQLHAAQQALATSEARLQAAEAVAGIGSYELDLAGGALHFSAGLCRLLGEVPGSFRPSLDWLDARSNPEDAQTVRHLLDQAIRAQQPYHYTRRIRRADGEWRVLESHGRVVSSPAGLALRLEGVVEDKTDQQRAAAALRTATQRLQAILDSSPDMLQVFEAVRDEQGELVDFCWVLNNQVSERIYGDVIGQRLLVQNPGVVETGIFDTFKQVVATGVPDQSERHYTSEQFNGWFYQSTVKLGDGVVVTTADISARKRSEQQVLRLQQEIAQRAVDKYHALFNSLEVGLCVLDLHYDAAGAAIDGIYREANPAFERQTGYCQPVGQRLSQGQPDLGRDWFERLAQVARTGTATRFAQAAPALGRWFEVYAFRAGTASQQVALLYTDVSEQRRQAQRQQFRLQLSDALQPLGDVLEIQQVASQLTRSFFGADRCYYAGIADGQCGIERDAAAAGLPSLVGRYDLRTLPPVGAALETGRPLVVEDVQTTALVADAWRQRCRQLQAVAFICVPISKNGQPVGMLCLTQGTPRRWAPEEVALVAEVAERTWVAVRRARAEARLHESEERFRKLVEAYAQAVWESDPHGLTVHDSPSWRAYTGQTRAEYLGYGWLAAIHPDDRPYAEQQ